MKLAKGEKKRGFKAMNPLLVALDGPASNYLGQDLKKDQSSSLKLERSGPKSDPMFAMLSFFRLMMPAVLIRMPFSIDN